MLGSDSEVQARLEGELDRLKSSDPYAALGLEPDASKAEIRAAFLRNTKVFHPNRFARRGREVIKVANEVFLRLKDAYTQLAGERSGKLRASTADNGRVHGETRRRTMPTNPLPAPPPPRVAHGSGPRGKYTARNSMPPTAAKRGVTQTNPLPAPPPQPNRLGESRRALSTARSSDRLADRLPKTRVRFRSNDSPDSSARSQVKPAAWERAGQAPPISDRARPDNRPGRDTRAAGRPAAPLDENSALHSHSERPAEQPVKASGSPAENPRDSDEFRRCLALLQLGQWGAAERVLRNLAANHPEDMWIMAHVHYARARAHQERGNLVDAHVELRRALEADASFEDARKAAESLSSNVPDYVYRIK
ncbi:MAG: J domain-containing protein [Proteobacteria bacterium]|nr:J domain-containing protein [Pseudomonadota bacterium]